MMKHSIVFSAIFLLITVVLFNSCRKDLRLQPIQIIPEPVSIHIPHLSPFVVDDHSIIYISDSSMYAPAVLLLSSLNKDYDIEMIDPTLVTHSGISLTYSPDTILPAHGYTLDIHTRSIVIAAHDRSGLWHGVQTLRQLLPPDHSDIDHASLPALNIIDYPRFDWRGMHLDVSRHYMPVSFIKKYLDMLSFHKLNVFHWHLVDDKGWRIEIKSHPELTDIGAWRVDKEGNKPKEDFEVWRNGDSRPKYGGYYSQEEIREVIAYATEKEITVVPEIELPGHSDVVLQCYPEFRCVDENGDYLPNNGVYCAGLKATFDLLEDVLEEVMDLFPSEYIHIGGDEVNKSNWKKCVRDMQLMSRKHLTPEEVQSYFISHFDRFLRSHGRKMMGRQEILEGNVSPSTAITFRGAPNDLEHVLREGHPTVLTTADRYYFDHYQSSSMNEPPAIGGLSTLMQVYQYEPYPSILEDKYGSQVLGIQANCSTEYMDNPHEIEYMVFPRIAAFASSAWSSGSKKNWSEFAQKIPRMLEFYKNNDINYASSAYRPVIDLSPTDNEGTVGLMVHIVPELSSDLFYTTDGSTPNSKTGTPYSSPFPVSVSTTVKAGAFQNGKALIEPEMKKVIVHKALGGMVELGNTPYFKYTAEGGATLVDGRYGGNNWGNGRWLGLLNTNVEATIHLTGDSTVQSVGYSAIEDQESNIYFPDQIQVSVSEDGQEYIEIAIQDIDRRKIHYDAKSKDTIFTITFPPEHANFLKVVSIPPKVQEKSVFLFVDEIIVE